MIKINLLPGYIVEQRRVKKLIPPIAALIVIELLVLFAYVWGPLPFSLKQKKAAAADRATAARQKALEVEQLEQEIADVRARFAAKDSWVTWVKRADEVPEAWVKYLTMITDTMPADVVINGLSLPSGGVLNLSGSTSDMMAAIRWYLNMLRSDIVQPGLESVQFNPGPAPAGETGPATDPMQMSVGMTVVLKPEVYEVLSMTPAPPGNLGGGTGRAGRGADRMGAGPGLGAGSRGEAARARGPAAGPPMARGRGMPGVGGSGRMGGPPAGAGAPAGGGAGTGPAVAGGGAD